MTSTVELLAAALRGDADVVRMLGQNVANADTTAFRRIVPVSRTFDAAAADVERGFVAAAPTTVAATDVRAGTLKSTSGPLDVAIEGGGYFVVSTPSGEQLTRRGDFRLDANGDLVTRFGDLVLGRGGAIRIGAGQVQISRDGSVVVDGATADQLRLADVDLSAQLEPAANGNYTVTAGQITDSTDASVRQGFLESSNVAPVNEILRLMEAVRHFETAQRFMRGYDDMVGLAITQLGKV